ncbi:hypothetical protein RHSIM_RhsimUnG0041300 [Rhododendron simsii]|uniref:Uncharacterized protein n=1 Tax=Rhododendron simsii TaxID=118357 RepID=A0A834FZK6_RHOSS|nr:hypothetical protein RHSIM_RhsimUnG0041300 [Rhododendron simsii]
MFIREAASAMQKQLPKKQCTSTGSCGRWVSAPFLLLLVLLILTQSVLGGQSVKYLPGYGELPFELETGYISVNEFELFYYFIPRKGTPKRTRFSFGSLGALAVLLSTDLFMNSMPTDIFHVTRLPFDIKNWERCNKSLSYTKDIATVVPVHQELKEYGLLEVLVECRTFAAFSQSIVKTLPGYAGDLPFKLETGYVSVGEWNDVHLFYYFIESEGNPELDPLILWLTGGPGCSGFCGLVYEIGPLHFDTEHFDGKFPNLTLNPFSWTKVASIIFLDAPVGTGFSYADNAESYVVDDLLSATDNYNFLLKWLMDHPTFLSNELYIGGDSYSGIIVPIVVQKIYEVSAKPSGRGSQSATVAAFDGGRGWSGLGNSEVGVQPLLNLQGYILGNPLTSEHDDKNARIEFAHRLALLSDKLYESIKYNCRGEYITIDPNNAPCIKDLTLVTEGTVEKWVRCNESLSYTEVVETSLDYHRNLSHTTLRALVYSGDHDMLIPYLGTHKWIESLNLTVDEEWRPWFVDGQNGGFVLA